MFTDKCTVVSIFPVALKEVKPGIYPQEYCLDASKANNDPQCLIVGPAKSYLENLLTEPPMVSIQWYPSDEIARSIVADYKIATFQVDGGSPGLGFLKGEYTPSKLMQSDEGERLLDDLVKKQNIWFKKIAELASDIWRKTQEVRAIAEIQRIAARRLNMDVPWLIENQIRVDNCPACMTPTRAGQIVCSACYFIIDPERYDPNRFARPAAPNVTVQASK